MPEGIEYATPETGVIEGVVKPAPLNPEDVVVDPETGTKIVKDEIGIIFKDNVSEVERNEIIASINGEVVGYGLSGQEVDVKIKDNPSIEDLKRIVEELNQNPKIEIADLTRIGTIYPKRIPDAGKDPQWNDSWDEKNPYGKNWGLEAIYAPSTWDYNDSVESIKIGIVDIGFKIEHEDLKIPGEKSNLWEHWQDEINSRIASLTDRKECVLEKETVINHGTHVAGIIGALSNNEVGITGTIWNRDLIVYEIDLKERNLLRGVEWLLNRGSKIINLSFGFDARCTSQEEIEGGQKYYNVKLNKLREKFQNFLIIQSAGNAELEAKKEILFNPELDKPEYEELKKAVITVGAIENKGKGKYQMANFSNYGDLVDVVAPGENIYSTLRSEPWWYEAPFTTCFDWFNSKYGCKSGTSMAAPFVTGVAGLVWGANSNLTAEQVKEIIVNSADRLITFEGREYKILNAKSSVKIAYELAGEAITGLQESLPEEEITRDIPEIIEKGGPAALVPPSTVEEKPKEEKPKEEATYKITGFVKDQHGESVKNADFWLMDIKGKKYGSSETSLTGYLEIDIKSIPEGDYTLHIEKVDWSGGTKIPYCDPSEKEINITKKDINLGIITVHKWSKITAEIKPLDEYGTPIKSCLMSTFYVIDKEGHSAWYYPSYPSHWRYLGDNCRLESYPLPDGEYTLQINIFKEGDIERKINISGKDIDLGEIVIQRKTQ